jgi:predicted  nucleic acid-binding Zn-ribbon protein
MDSRIIALKARREEKPRALAPRQEIVEDSKKRLAVKQDEIKKLKLDVARKETDLKDQDGKISKLNVQLFQLKTNKEYSLMQSEISSHKADKSLMEDELLALMSRVESTEREMKELKAAVDSIEKEFEQARAQVDKEIAQIDVQMDEQMKLREQALVGIPKPLLQRYERVLQRRPDGIVVSQVILGDGFDEDGNPKHTWVCEGCGMQLTAQEVNTIKKGKDQLACKACSRILYLP